MTDEPADQTDPIAVWKESPGFGRALTIGVTIGAIASFLAVGGGILLVGQGVAVAIGLGLLALVTFLWTLKSGQYDDLEGASQRILVSSGNGRIALRAAGLIDNPAGVTFGEPVLRPDSLDSLPAPFGAYKFPEATSLSK